MDKRERKMNKEQLEGLLHMRHRNAVHKPKKEKEVLTDKKKRGLTNEV